MDYDLVISVEGVINHFWQFVLADLATRKKAGIRYISHRWVQGPLWLIWLINSPGVYNLAMNKVLKTEEHCWEASFSVKYYPALEEPDFKGLSALEKMCRESDIFNSVATYGKCECASCGRSKRAAAKQRPQLTGAPAYEQIEIIPEDFFYIGQLDINYRGVDRSSAISIETLSRWQVRAAEDIHYAAEGCVTEILLYKGEIYRDFPGYEKMKLMYDRIVEGWDAYIGSPQKTKVSYIWQGVHFLTNGIDCTSQADSSVTRQWCHTRFGTDKKSNLIDLKRQKGGEQYG